MSAEPKKVPSRSGRWADAAAVKGSTADLRKSAATLREQVAKDTRVFSQNSTIQNKKR